MLKKIKINKIFCLIDLLFVVFFYIVLNFFSLKKVIRIDNGKCLQEKVLESLYHSFHYGLVSRRVRYPRKFY